MLISCNIPETYKVTGVIKEIEPSNNKLLIDHDIIPGFMDPMIMYFNIDNTTNLNLLSINDSIIFDFLVYKEKSKIININILGKSKSSELDEWQDLTLLKKIGENIDDFSFVNTSYKTYSLSEYANDNFLVITFIFSKCPMPNMCPASITKNQYLSETFKNENINFLLVSFDYIYDTPQILKNIYGTIETENLIFLSSYKNKNDIIKLAEQAGVGFWGVEKNNIGHTMKTIILDKDLKLLKTFDGTDWKPGNAKNYINNLFKVIK